MRWNCKRPIFNFLVPPAKDLVEEAWGLIARQSSNRAKQADVRESPGSKDRQIWFHYLLAEQAT